MLTFCLQVEPSACTVFLFFSLYFFGIVVLSGGRDAKPKEKPSLSVWAHPPKLIVPYLDN